MKFQMLVSLMCKYSQNKNHRNWTWSSNMHIWSSLICYNTRLKYVYYILSLLEDATKCFGRYTIKIILLLSGRAKTSSYALIYSFTFSILSTLYNMCIYLITYQMLNPADCLWKHTSKNKIQLFFVLLVRFYQQFW